ncbi:hypothetical protein Tco_1252868 [Tanacetum coccineum]
MTTLADKAILLGADNRPPMLEKDMYDSWKSIIELYMMNRQHERMILESVENDPLIWPIIEENGVTIPRKYSELTHADAIQADCDVKATNITLQGLPPEVYTLVIHHKVAKDLWARIQLLMQGTLLAKQERECDDPIDAINHMMSFLSVVVTSRYPTTNNQLRNLSNPRQQATINDGRVTLQPVQGRQIYFATGFQNPFYPKKAQQLEPKLYDGNVIKNTYAIEIPDSEETLMLAEEGRLKMLLKQQDPMILENKVNTKPIDYAALNQLSQDFEK